MSTYTVQVFYDPPDDPVQVLIEATSTSSLEQARTVMRRMVDALKWDTDYCYSDDMPEMQREDD